MFILCRVVPRFSLIAEVSIQSILLVPIVAAQALQFARYPSSDIHRESRKANGAYRLI